MLSESEKIPFYEKIVKKMNKDSDETDSEWKQ